MTEAEIQQDIRIALGRERDFTIWRNETGQARHPGRNGRTRHVRYGLCRGSSDLIGILSPTGRMVALECKTPTGRLDDEQRMFLELIRSRGGFATVVRSVEDAVSALDRARQGLSE